MKVIMVYIIAPTVKNNSHEVANTELGFSKGSILLDTISVILYMPKTTAGPGHSKINSVFWVAETDKLIGHCCRLRIWT